MDRFAGKIMYYMLLMSGIIAQMGGKKGQKEERGLLGTVVR